MAETELKYTGDGAFVPGVPARDLTADDLAALKDADDLAVAAYEDMAKALPKGERAPDVPPRRDRRWLQKSGLYEPDAPAKQE